MEILLQLVVVGFLVEAIVDTMKLVYDTEQGIQIPKILSIAVGLVLAFVIQLDILQLLKLTADIHIVGVALTGILVSRGGNFVNDLFDKLKGDEIIG